MKQTSSLYIFCVNICFVYEFAEFIYKVEYADLSKSEFCDADHNLANVFIVEMCAQIWIEMLTLKNVKNLLWLQSPFITSMILSFLDRKIG